MKRKMAIVLTATLFMAALSACGSKEPASATSTSPSSQTEITKPEDSAKEQDSAPETPDVEEPVKNLKELKSDFGYTISYEEDRYEYRRIEGFDEFGLKSQEEDKPLVFISISFVGAEYVEAVKAEYLGDQTEPCTIGKAQIQSECSETEEDWEGGKTITKSYVCPIDSGDALLIETQWYTEQADNTYEAELWDILSSIEL